jgi:hypothetical protein
MNPLTLINAGANLAVAVAVLDVSFRVMGRPSHPIHRHKVALLIRKLVSSVVICGAALNLLTLSTPSWTEVVLNVGFSASYIWSSYYDRLTHTKHPSVSIQVPRKRSNSRAGGARPAKKSIAAGWNRGKRTAA